MANRSSHLCSWVFQERLEKEKKLSKDLGQAATKLQQLLRTTQEQLGKERDAVRKLQDQLQAKVTCQSPWGLS